MNSGGARARSVVGTLREVESKVAVIVDPLEALDWSDDESDWKIKVPAREEPEAFDVEKTAEQPAVVHVMTHTEDFRRAKLYRDVLKRNAGDATIHIHKPFLPSEMRQNKYSSFRLPLPYTPQHVIESLGMDIIEHLWHEFLQHGADESELIQVQKLKSICKAMRKHMGYSIAALEELRFAALDEDDYVDFREVTMQMVLWADQRQQLVQQVVIKDENEVLGRCCAIDSCTIKTVRSSMAEAKEDRKSEGGDEDRRRRRRSSKGQQDDEHKGHGHEAKGWAKNELDEEEEEEKDEEEEEEEEEEDEGEHSLHVAWLRFRLNNKGTVRIKHVCELMDEVFIPYDKSRIPSSEWTIRGELLLTSPKELQSLCERIRTDKDYERNKAKDDIYKLPRWMETEFSQSEIMLFKRLFSAIDCDGGGALDADELIALTAQMGNQVTEEQAKDLIGLMDLDGSGTVDFGEFMMLLYKIQNGVIDLEGNMLAQAMVEAKTQLSIFDEIEELHRNPPPYGQMVNYGGNPVQCDIAITGPENTLYEGGTYRLRVILLNGYPFRLPDITFQTRVYHLNVLSELDGLGYFPHMKYLWDSSWSLRRLVGHIVDLMKTPRIDYVPVELVKVVKVFFYEEKEKRRIAEEKRLAELARLAEIARLEELARLEEERRQAEAIELDKKNRLREFRAMASEDRQNEYEIQLMALEDQDAAATREGHDDDNGSDGDDGGDEKSTATFSSKRSLADDVNKQSQSKEEGDKSSPIAAAASPRNKKSADDEVNDDDDDDEDFKTFDLRPRKSAQAKPSGGASSSSNSNSSSEPGLAVSKIAVGNDMMQADSKDTPNNTGRRGSKASSHCGGSNTARSHKMGDDDDDDAKGQDKAAQPDTTTTISAASDEEETFIGWSSQEMLKPLMRVQQMHLTVVQFFLGERHRYDENARDFVRKFAWTTHAPVEKEKVPPDEELDEEAQAFVLRLQLEGFSLAEMALSLRSEIGVNTSAASLGVWFHTRLQAPPEPGGDLGEIEDKAEEEEEKEEK